MREITGGPDVNLIGFCVGGIIATTVLSQLAATGNDCVHSMSYAVTLLDFGLRAPITAFSGRALIALAGYRSPRTGITTSRKMGSAFTWLRPDDLVFGYWVNNYLMGQAPPAFDILAWNANGTNLSGALHSQFLDIFSGSLLTRPGALSVLGTSVQLQNVTVPAFVTGPDHLTPWPTCNRTTQLLGGPSTFVLSYSGHIASLVNPPGNLRRTTGPAAHQAPTPSDGWLAPTGSRAAGGSRGPSGITARAGDRQPQPETLAASATRYCAPRPASTSETWCLHDHLCPRRSSGGG